MGMGTGTGMGMGTILPLHGTGLSFHPGGRDGLRVEIPGAMVTINHEGWREDKDSCNSVCLSVCAGLRACNGMEEVISSASFGGLDGQALCDRRLMLSDEGLIRVWHSQWPPDS